MTPIEDERPRLAHQVELLGASDWRTRLAAERALDQAGQAALDLVVEGLTHPSAAVRRQCAAFMDHHADDRCVPQLYEAVNDPVPSVRREALHALGCQQCKPAPLAVDALPVLIDHALGDPSKRVRLSAVAGIGRHPRDPRAVAPLQTVLGQETDRLVRKHAHRALRHHEPAYRSATDAAARARATEARRTDTTDTEP